ncbi:T9SS type A sorting domain-containing protein [Hymenobacter sp. B1770]|uniref:T9SS type A sorting domain-containing protein n=1 Tax=Hymenobacter sp. B1770 TaxID=1718788 RepID=UPI003CF14CE7
MKKILLFLGLLAFGSSAYAQTGPNLGPWVEVNRPSIGTALSYRISYVHTVSPTVAWLVAQENNAGSVPQYVFVTNNATGTQFGLEAVSAGSQNFQTANVFGLSSTVALAATHGPNGGGEILRTTNGGLSWTKVSTTAQFVQNQGGFLNMVHMFNAQEGMAMGDPTGTPNAYFEILRTTDGGLTWNRIPAANIPAPFAGEAGLVHSVFARGNTLWFGGASLGTSDRERVFKTTDRGQTWTVSQPTTLTETIRKVVFKDDLNGIAYNVKDNGSAVTEVNVIRTSDGGATWSPITPVNTATGSFFWYDIDAVDGRYYSVGQRFPATGVDEDFGSSYSTDGINWTNMNTGQGFFAFDLIPGATPGSATGYAGTLTDATGGGGIFRLNNLTATATRDAALQGALSAYPNPSHSGVFKVALGTTLRGHAQLTVLDALGRQVRSQALSATAIGSRELHLDLSGQKTGVYTLQIRTDAGIATQKLVIN